MLSAIIAAYFWLHLQTTRERKFSRVRFAYSGYASLYPVPSSQVSIRNLAIESFRGKQTASSSSLAFTASS